MYRDIGKQLNRESCFKRSRLSVNTQLDWPLQIFAEPNIVLITWFIQFIGSGRTGKFLQNLSLLHEGWWNYFHWANMKVTSLLWSHSSLTFIFFESNYISYSSSLESWWPSLDRQQCLILLERHWDPFLPKKGLVVWHSVNTAKRIEKKNPKPKQTNKQNHLVDLGQWSKTVLWERSTKLPVLSILAIGNRTCLFDNLRKVRS